MRRARRQVPLIEFYPGSYYVDVGRLCSTVVRAADRQSKVLGSNPSAVESVFFSTERFLNSLKTCLKFRIVLPTYVFLCQLY